jgi:hypothetical protein
LGRCLTRKLLNVVASLYSVSTYCEFWNTCLIIFVLSLCRHKWKLFSLSL